MPPTRRTFVRRTLAATLLAGFATGAVAQTSTTCDDQCQADALLDKGSLSLCPTTCGTYRAGADATNLMVCQYFGNGRGTFAQRVSDGATCMPAYNCRDDWNLCVQWDNNTAGATINDQAGLASDAPYANLDDADVIRTACGDISGLTVQTTGSANPPAGGWAPTSLGWHKGEGNIGCGYGSTYAITPLEQPLGTPYEGDELTLGDFGRVVIDGITDIVDCCVKAMEYEGATMEQGGKAVRFDVLNGQCRIDREMMMKGNLDSSTGKSMAYVVPCGSDDDDEYFYWRHTAGGADGASLSSAGGCAARFNFTKVTSSENFLPFGKLPQQGIEVPNHIGLCSDSTENEYDVAKCQYGVQYNTITDAEQCCEACVNLQWLNATTHANDTPCIAFQIVNGRCQIIREHFITTEFGSAGLALTAHSDAGGNVALGITETVEFCTSEDPACLRENNKHGDWSSCEENAESVDGLCEYYSFLYFRDRQADGEFSAENANATKPSYVSFDVFEPADLTGGIDITINATLMEVRTGKNLTKAPVSDASNSSGYNLTVASVASAGYNDTNPACVRIRMYESDPDAGTDFLTSVDDTYTIDPENNTAARTIVAESELCCPTADGGGCPLSLSFTEEEANDASSSVGRKLLQAAANGRSLVLAYECEGTGGDVCDMQRVAYNVPNLGASPPAADAASEGGADGSALVPDDEVSAASATAASFVLAVGAGIAALAVHA